MLRSVKEIRDYRIMTKDGAAGKLKDLLFDDRSWRVRYAVVETDGWFSGERFLVSPSSMGAPNWEHRSIPVDLTREQIEAGPRPLADPPVSRAMEIELSRIYQWPAYWSEPPSRPVGSTGEDDAPGDPHLRSADVVIGYRIEAEDDRVGHVEDLVVDVESWEVVLLVVDTRNWLPGKKVLITPGSATRIEWDPGLVRVELTREEIVESPVWDPTAPVNREWRALVTDVHGRPA